MHPSSIATALFLLISSQVMAANLPRQPQLPVSGCDLPFGIPAITVPLGAQPRSMGFPNRNQPFAPGLHSALAAGTDGDQASNWWEWDQLGPQGTIWATSGETRCTKDIEGMRFSPQQNLDLQLQKGAKGNSWLQHVDNGILKSWRGNRIARHVNYRNEANILRPRRWREPRLFNWKQPTTASWLRGLNRPRPIQPGLRVPKNPR